LKKLTTAILQACWALAHAFAQAGGGPTFDFRCKSLVMNLPTISAMAYLYEVKVNSLTDGVAGFVGLATTRVTARRRNFQWSGTATIHTIGCRANGITVTNEDRAEVRTR
jgi:hypothetical protein